MRSSRLHKVEFHETPWGCAFERSQTRALAKCVWGAAHCLIITRSGSHTSLSTVLAGEVTVYGGDAPKPPVGQGLNTHCEITLYGVYKKERDTGQAHPTK